MQDGNAAPGPNIGSGSFQIINETDSIIRGAGEYYQGGRKGDGGDSDSENDTSSKFTAGGFTQYSGPKPGKKTRGRVKIEMKFIDNKLRRYTTFSKRKTGIMKKVRILIFVVNSCSNGKIFKFKSFYLLTFYT